MDIWKSSVFMSMNKALRLKKCLFFVLSQIILTLSKIIEKTTYIYDIK
jgi:hypothetical protein